MLDLKVLHTPATPEDAFRALNETDGRGLYVGGGTVVVRAGSPNLDFLVDLSRAGMSYVRSESGNLVLGAATTLASLTRSMEACGIASCVLHDAALAVGTHTIRNLATVGGNLVTWPFPSDLPVAFLVLDATLLVMGESGPREVALIDFFARGADVWTKGELMVEVRVPIPGHGLTGGFDKIGRKRIDVALANAAAAIDDDGGRMRDVRVAVGGVGSAPARLPECESFLKGKAPGADLFAEAGRMAAESVEPRSDHRAGASYRKRAAGVAVERALMRAAGLLPRR